MPSDDLENVTSWWVCLACRSRWTRRNFTPTTQVNRSDQMHFGKYASLTYTELYHQYPQYARWAVQTCEEDPEAQGLLVRFAQYVKRMQNIELTEINGAKDPTASDDSMASNITGTLDAGGADAQHRS